MTKITIERIGNQIICN